MINLKIENHGCYKQLDLLELFTDSSLIASFWILITLFYFSVNYYNFSNSFSNLSQF